MVLEIYNKDIDFIEVAKRIGQVFGMDILSKSGKKNLLSNDIDIALSAYPVIVLVLLYHEKVWPLESFQFLFSQH